MGGPKTPLRTMILLLFHLLNFDFLYPFVNTFMFFYMDVQGVGVVYYLLRKYTDFQYSTVVVHYGLLTKDLMAEIQTDHTD